MSAIIGFEVTETSDWRDDEIAERMRPVHTAPGPVLARIRAQEEQEPSFIDMIIDRIKAAGKRVDDINFAPLAAQFLRDHGVTDTNVGLLLVAWIRDLVDPAIDEKPKGALMFPRLTVVTTQVPADAFHAFRMVMAANKIVSIGIADPHRMRVGS